MPSSPRTPLTLAALATAAIPGLNVVATRPPSHPVSDFDTASLMDHQGRRWVVQAPKDAAAGATLEAEVELLVRLARAGDEQHLTFAVPRPAGFAPLSEGGRAMVYPELPGRVLDVESVSAQLAQQIGQTLAQVHALDERLIADAGLPVYDAETFRNRRLAEVDEAAKTGHVPTALLRRWEHALENVRLWRFVAVPVHGDIAAEHLLVADDAVTAVVNWGQAKVADPADDLSWLLAAAPEETGEAILAAYTEARGALVDDHLSTRATLASELALARWLMHGVRVRDNEIIDDAIQMLRELEEVVADDEPLGVPSSASPASANRSAVDAGVATEDLPVVSVDSEDEAVPGDDDSHHGRAGIRGGGADPAPAVIPPAEEVTAEIAVDELREPDYERTRRGDDDSPTAQIPPATG